MPITLIDDRSEVEHCMPASWAEMQRRTIADLQPVDEVGDILAHRLGAEGRIEVVILRRAQPVNHNHVSTRLPPVQCSNQPSNPALKHSCDL
ncbi:hypothetical protein AGOR_G00240990 [Albula goreensis]|uniref:Uncharacterized protein n=1 Tax=Albula goreensis TaxID=1534307 RepID=A0A8T3CJW6_9TELE|nr:hypothetical protein AGOR_G00240990 [Albula goreensis]